MHIALKILIALAILAVLGGIGYGIYAAIEAAQKAEARADWVNVAAPGGCGHIASPFTDTWQDCQALCLQNPDCTGYGGNWIPGHGTTGQCWMRGQTRENGCGAPPTDDIRTLVPQGTQGSGEWWYIPRAGAKPTRTWTPPQSH